MKIHLMRTIPYSTEALNTWVSERLIIGQEKICDDLMMFTKHEKFTTFDKSKVTCKRCLKKL